MQYDYSNQFTEDSQVAQYERKFKGKIDIVRHQVECRVIKRHAAGDLYDCSIGHGRFVTELPKVETYSAMDYSEAFIRYIEGHYPQVTVRKGDLLNGIEEPDDRYDTVLCIRTLSGLGEAGSVIGEMIRIAKPGGTIIFDYDREDDPGINEVLQENPATIIKTVRVDSPFALGIKRNSRLSKLFNHRVNVLPLGVYTLLERAWGSVSGERILYIAQKNIPTTG
ncbi:MAG: class I SAM-dependent methyltransferase [Anaerolineae bacterium]|nr:class I SAM-dependent methyltransferase [Anaerolineae bacterium]